MNKPAIETIHGVMRDANMIIFDAPFDVTLGGIRTKDNLSGKFNDYLFACLYDQHGNLHHQIVEGTTDAGLYYRENPINVNGTAIIQHGVQHRGAYHYENPQEDASLRGHRGTEAFRQVGKMKYWRDADRDKYLEFDGPEDIDNFATNGHFMGTVGNDVDKWSAGCWGSIKGNMHLLYGFARAQIAHGHANSFSFALLHEDMF